MWKYKTPGIPDENFERTDKVPITKEEVRVVQIAKGRLQLGYTVYDIGCGSGSISVEAALQVESSGKVYSIDIDPQAIDLTKKNLDKFGVSNVTVILGNAVENLSNLPEANNLLEDLLSRRYEKENLLHSNHILLELEEVKAQIENRD